MNPKTLSCVLFLGALAACGSTRRDPPTTSKGDAGTLVRVPGGNVTVGFHGGRLTASATLAAYSISKNPVTVREFKTCVAADACRWPASSCANAEGAEGDVALCVGFDSAASYCGWVGGKLPTLAEWMRAARGSAVRRFAWGEEAATCEQHPEATAPPTEVVTREDAMLRRESGYCGVSADARLRTGEHPVGASPSGMEDVLLSQGELVRGSADSPISVCLSTNGGCVVFGLLAGAIDAAEMLAPLDTSEQGAMATVAHPYGFRCVKPEEAL